MYADISQRLQNMFYHPLLTGSFMTVEDWKQPNSTIMGYVILRNYGAST